MSERIYTPEEVPDSHLRMLWRCLLREKQLKLPKGKKYKLKTESYNDQPVSPELTIQDDYLKVTLFPDICEPRTIESLVSDMRYALGRLVLAGVFDFECEGMQRYRNARIQKEIHDYKLANAIGN
ncbi:hypothetical protein ACFLRC_03615 [Candidatus Altiarchaeota archaeon]